MSIHSTGLLALGISVVTCVASAQSPPISTSLEPGFVQDKGAKTLETEKKRKPKFTISKETTYVLGPVDKDGFIDYETALNERLHHGVTPANNANVLIWKAIGPRPDGKPMPGEFWKWLEIEAPLDHGEYFIELDQYIREHLKIDNREQADEVGNQLTRARQRSWTAKQFPHIANWLKANQTPLSLVTQATKRPHYFSPVLTNQSDKEPAPRLTGQVTGAKSCREMANALTARAMLLIGERRFDDAWQDLLTCHRLARAVAQGGRLPDYLVGVAIESVACSADMVLLESPELNAQQLEDRRRELQLLPQMPTMADSVEFGERFQFLSMVMTFSRGGAEGMQRLAGEFNAKGPDIFTKAYVDAIDWDPVMRTGHEWFDRLVSAMRTKKRAVRVDRLDEIHSDAKFIKSEMLKPATLLRAVVGNSETKGKILGDYFMILLVPALLKMQEASDRTEQIQANLQLAFALAAYQRDHRRYPDKLDELAPKYLPKIPDDIFSGKPLVYRPSNDGYLLYSLGVNGRDDDGRTYGDEPYGDDLPVRMPLPPLPPR